MTVFCLLQRSIGSACQNPANPLCSAEIWQFQPIKNPYGAGYEQENREPYFRAI